MRTVALLVLVALLLAGCNRGPEPEPAWIPNFDTPEHASETYARAIESADLELALMCIAPADREAFMPRLRHNLELAKRDDLKISVAFENPEMATEDEALAVIVYTVVNKEGETVGQPERVLVAFLKQPDGTWRYSPVRANEWQRASEPQPEPDPEEQPEQTPPSEETPEETPPTEDE